MSKRAGISSGKVFGDSVKAKGAHVINRIILRPDDFRLGVDLISGVGTALYKSVVSGIYVFGWKLGFIYAEIGVVGGAVVAFWIARKYREPVVRRFVTLQKLHTWEDTLSERKKFWSLVGLRLITGPLLFDFVNYVAGLTKINFGKFLVATIIGSLPMMIPIYYFGDKLLSHSFYLITTFILVVLMIGLAQKWWYKKHFIEKQ